MVSDSASWSGPTSPPAADRPAKPGQAAPVRAKRKGKNPGLASIYRALAQHQKRQRYPEAVEQAHADFAAYPPDFPEYYGDPPTVAPRSGRMVSNKAYLVSRLTDTPTRWAVTVRDREANRGGKGAAARTGVL